MYCVVVACRVGIAWDCGGEMGVLCARHKLLVELRGAHLILLLCRPDTATPAQPRQHPEEGKEGRAGCGKQPRVSTCGLATAQLAARMQSPGAGGG